MPKEKIYDDCALFDVEVGWSTDSSVQVGIVTHTGVSLADWLKQGADDAGDPAGFNSLWATLDRSSVNRLIRTLRRARDVAYGKDE